MELSVSNLPQKPYIVWSLGAKALRYESFEGKGSVSNLLAEESKKSKAEDRAEGVHLTFAPEMMQLKFMGLGFIFFSSRMA